MKNLTSRFVSWWLNLNLHLESGAYPLHVLAAVNYSSLRLCVFAPLRETSSQFPVHPIYKNQSSFPQRRKGAKECPPLGLCLCLRDTAG
jgi:hypothetical protein